MKEDYGLQVERLLKAPELSVVCRLQHRQCLVNRQRGLSLIELVSVIIIVGVLAAIAVPRYIAMGRDARVASLQTLASAMKSINEYVHALCVLNPNCSYSGYPTVTITGKQAALAYGYLNAGDNLGVNEIDAWINYAGFTASISGNANTLFTLDGSPDPPNCSVNYYEPQGPTIGAVITILTSGC